MTIRQADAQDVSGLARLLWLDTCGVQSTDQAPGFETDLAGWWTTHAGTHAAFVAQADGPELVGMAWIALTPRVPRPSAITRISADVQSVFVLPEHRRQGVGSALVQAACEHAQSLGAARITVHSGRRAVHMYERLGFASSPQLLQQISPPT